MDQNGVKVSQKSDEVNEEIKGKIVINLVKRKRRSKNEAEGRSFVCECGKSYLSQPALTNHRKTKHDFDKNTEKRGRGRPRKNVVNNTDMIQKAEIKFKTYFDKDSRRKGTENLHLTFNQIERVYIELIAPYKDKFLYIYNTIDSNPLLRLIISQINPNGSINAKENHKSCDEINYEYLKDVISKTNENYFLFIFKFVILFRDCINKFKKNDQLPDKEFCENNGAEFAPDLCNEFIIDFMEVNNYFGLNSEEQKNEFIEIIQHYCLWLYENGHTSSRLTLLI